MTQIDPGQTIAEILTDHSERLGVFRRHGIEIPAHGRMTLDALCAHRGLDRNQMVRELEAAEEEAPRAGAFEWDLASGVVRWSADLCRVYGIEPGEFGGTVEAFLEYIPPEDRERTRHLIERSLEKRKSFTYEHPIVRRDGATRILYSRVDIISGDGEPVRMVGTCWDVTDQQSIDGSLQGSVSLLRSTLEATIDGILVVDRTGVVTAMNARFLTLWRIPNQIVGEHSDDALLAAVLDQLEEPERFLAKVRELYANPERESFDVLRFKDGRVFERYSRPQRVDQAIVGRVWSFRDVSERERLLTQQTFLADSSRLLGSLEIESALQALARRAVPYLGDACAIDLFEEGEVRRVVSYARDPSRPLELVRPSRVDVPAIYDVGPTPHLAVPLMAKDRPVGTLIVAFQPSPRRLYTRADRDVGEELGRRIALAIENARLLREARAAIAARDEFLSIAAHEIRGPLSSIRLAVESLQNLQLAPEIRDRMLALLNREGRRLARFAEDLVALGSLRAGELSLEPQEVHLTDAVREVCERVSDEIQRSGSTVSITSDGPVIGYWDRFRIDQVVMNLLSNALKFGLGKPIEIHVEAHEGWATLVVVDRGLGVAEDQRDRIFHPFERGVSVRHYGGLGLGLYIVRTIVSQMGGTVHVEPHPGGGSRFIVRLPQASTA